MLLHQKVVVVMPAYNAAKTLEKTYKEIPGEYVDNVILVDDASSDDTSQIAERLGMTVKTLPQNLGYGGNQKHCYRLALENGAEIIVMVHPDYQYNPKLITAMAAMIASGIYDVVLGSRILASQPVKDGMPLYKYAANRVLTLIQNLLLGTKLSEYHTGYRAFHRRVLEFLPWEENSNDFVFDNQILTQAVYSGYRIGEISCPAKYFPEASSINFLRSLYYGWGVLVTSFRFLFHRLGFLPCGLFPGKFRSQASQE